MKKYHFKKDAEFLWAIIVAGIIAVAQLVTTSPSQAIHTKEFWATIALGAFARAAGGALLSKVATE